MKTVVLHTIDKSTDFLKPIYEDLPDKKVYRRYTHNNNILQDIKEADLVIMLGHGSPFGLFSWGNLFRDPEFIQALKEKEGNNIYIWCHASDWVIEHRLEGFSTGMFISEVGEAACYKIQVPQRDIDLSNNLFAGLVREGLVEENITDMEKLRNFVHREYYSDTCEVIDYNRERLVYLDGTIEPPEKTYQQFNLYDYYNEVFGENWEDEFGESLLFDDFDYDRYQNRNSLKNKGKINLREKYQKPKKKISPYSKFKKIFKENFSKKRKYN
jgi:hypothetical protein